MTNREYIIDYLKTLSPNINYENRNNGSIATSFCVCFFDSFNDTCGSCPYDSTGCIPLSEERLNKFMEREFSGKEPEVKQVRKKGKWLKVGGFATPGGTPVWRCSVCGKGQHVYGIEASSYAKDVADHQWLSCPNCDAEMSE